MKFADLLYAAIQRSEIPLRFEPGAEEAVARPILAFLEAWLEAHQPPARDSAFDAGQSALIGQLVDELNGRKEVPSA